MQAPSQGDVIRFRIPGDPSHVPLVRRAIRSIARSLGFSEQAAEDIELSVAEAVSNAVEHGSPEHGRNAVVVVCTVLESSLTIDVRDEGPGFDVSGFEDCEDSLDERGRGLRLIYHLMDKVKVLRTPNGGRIRMVKNIRLPRKNRSTTSSAA